MEVYREYLGIFQLVGHFSADDGHEVFRYDESYLVGSDAHPLSNSLPLRNKPFSREEYLGFFEGLAPEGRLRTEFARHFVVAPSSFLELLAHLNFECVGAILFKSPETDFSDFEPKYRRLKRDELLQLASSPVRTSVGLAIEGRFSLAGTQSKLGIYLDESTLAAESEEFTCYLPEGTAPSTHIVKIPDPEYRSLPANEMFCQSLAKACGLRTAQSLLLQVDKELPVFVTRRYDRPMPKDAPLVSGLRRPLRLHQEDICQALGLPPYRKYEIEDQDDYPLIIAQLLERVSSDPIRDRLEFAQQVIFDYLIGNCDNHIKNYSLLLSSDWSACALAPAYDMMSTTVLGYSREMGLSVGDTRTIDRITLEDWRLFARDMHLPEARVLNLLKDLAARFIHNQAAVAEELSNMPGNAVIQDIIADAKPRCKKLL